MDAIQPRLLAHCPHLLHPTFQAADSLSLLCRMERSLCDVRGCEGLSVKDCGERSWSRARGPALSQQGFGPIAPCVKRTAVDKSLS